MRVVDDAAQRLGEVVGQTWPVLLDFDGPLTHLFIDGRSIRLANQLRTVLHDLGVTVPPEIEATTDPLAVLRWSGLQTADAVREAVEAVCVEGEHQCVDESDPTPGSHALLQACHRAGRPVVIVSNNASGPIQHHLDRHQLPDLVHAIVGRTPGHPELMKPHPDSIERALKLLDQPAQRCAFIGDSVTDIDVSHLTGVRSIGFAKNPRRGDELAVSGADAVVRDLTDLAIEIDAQAQARTHA